MKLPSYRIGLGEASYNPSLNPRTSAASASIRVPYFKYVRDYPLPRLLGRSVAPLSQAQAALLALGYVVLMGLVALFSPAIAGTKPIVCKYKGSLYFPALGYFNPRWENPIFRTDRFRNVYSTNLKKKDPESWAIWPLFYQDPYRTVRDGEWPDQPGNPARDQGKPSRQQSGSAPTAPASMFSRRWSTARAPRSWSASSRWASPR